MEEYPLLTDPEMKEIVESFLIESKEILEKLDSDLIEYERNPEDKELVNTIFRAFHTIKGTSGFLGLIKLTEVTHNCEDLLNKLRKGEVSLSSSIMDAILLSYDTIKSLVNQIEFHQNENIEVEHVINLLVKLLDSISNGTQLVDEVTEQASIELDVDEDSDHTIETEQSLDVDKAKVVEEKKSDNTIRVSIERLNELLNITSELVLGRNRLAQVNSEVALEYEGSKLSRDLAEITKLIDIMTNELQLNVMKVRLVKIGKVFNRFPRLIRDLLKETKKDAQLIIKGEDTELDKTLIEEINDPLVHLVRNSLDHGIEFPEERLAKGKDKKGTVKLQAEQEGNNIIITIEDDGKGMNPDAILNKAIQKGLVTKEKAKDFTKQDIFNLIFIPGFSTAEVVTNISGRGVGMDVVKTNVTKLRGMINVESEVGIGTKIIIKLPITLAIIQGMIVRVGSEKVVIPLNSILEVVRVSSKEIYSINQKEVIRVRESILPLLEIGKIVYDQNFENDAEWQYIVVVGIAEKRFGIKVDGLVGQKEIVIKSLGSYLGNIDGIAGSTIMGDGSVLMILDLNEVINKYTESLEYTN